MNSTAGRRRPPDADSARRRRAALSDLLEHVRRRRDAAIAWDAVPALAAVFADDEDVLRDLGGMWSRALAGQIDWVLDDHDDLTDVLADAAGRVATARPALHAVLAAYAAHPVVQNAARRDAARLGVRSTRAHAGHLRPRYVLQPDIESGVGSEENAPPTGDGRSAAAGRGRCWRWLVSAPAVRGA
jgi:hypothetical protein